MLIKNTASPAKIQTLNFCMAFPFFFKTYWSLQISRIKTLIILVRFYIRFTVSSQHNQLSVSCSGDLCSSEIPVCSPFSLAFCGSIRFLLWESVQSCVPWMNTFSPTHYSYSLYYHCMDTVVLYILSNFMWMKW